MEIWYRKMNKKQWNSLLVILSIMLFVSACGGGTTTTGGPPPDEGDDGPSYSYHFDVGGGNFSNTLTYQCDQNGNHDIYLVSPSTRVGDIDIDGYSSYVEVYLYDETTGTYTELEFDCNGTPQSGNISAGQIRLSWSYNGNSTTYSLN